MSARRRGNCPDPVGAALGLPDSYEPPTRSQDMSSKKNKKATTGGNVPALKIGSRVRCTDDGVMGKITWANGVSVKIKWDDGEQVTWKRDSLATPPIAILDADTETPTEQT